MFDLNADDGSVRKKQYRSPIPDDEAPKPRRRVNNLDKPEAVQLHLRLMDLYVREMDRQHDNRIEQAVEEDFYDNIQWREADAQQLRDRGQVPLVYNVTSASIDWVLGTERRARTDFKVLPRRKEDGKPAERKTQLLKYLSDVNRAPFHVSRAFADAVKVGIGWIEDGIADDDDAEPIYTRYENWRNVLWDSAATELDLSDGRYIFRSRWVDVDIACAFFPKRKAVIDAAAADANNFIGLDMYGDEAMDQHEQAMEQAGGAVPSDRITGYQRRRVRLIECWYRRPEQVDRLRGGPFHGEIFDPLSRGHRESVEGQEAETYAKTAMRMHVAIFTTAGMIWMGPSPYRHNRFPLTPVWGYRRGRDGMPYGMVRRVKDIQEDVNKRASKALFILSTNKVIMEEGAVDDVDELAEEVARPDGVIIKKRGAELQINADRELSQYQLELMSRSIGMIQQTSGVTDELLGRRTNATSGIAIERRQDQGSMATTSFFDNLRFAQQVRGEKQLSLVEQFMDERKAFRITNMRGQPEYVEVNDGLPENDIVRSKADFVISEGDWRSTMRQSAVEALLDAATRWPPEIIMVMLDLLVENMDLPNREEIVRRIRSVTGQRDPDAEEPTEEELAQMQAKAAADQLQQVMQMLELRKRAAETGKIEAEAARVGAQAGLAGAQTITERINQQIKALAAARDALGQPATADVADHILHESGFNSRTDMEEAAGAMAAQEQEALGISRGPSGPAPAAQAESLGLQLA